MADMFEVWARDIIDMERSMRDHKHGEDTIKFAIANYLRVGYQIALEADDNMIPKDRAYEYVKGPI
jgi:hypothetical protein